MLDDGCDGAHFAGDLDVVMPVELLSAEGDEELPIEDGAAIGADAAHDGIVVSLTDDLATDRFRNLPYPRLKHASPPLPALFFGGAVSDAAFFAATNPALLFAVAFRSLLV
jgi:hypothetical protein